MVQYKIRKKLTDEELHRRRLARNHAHYLINHGRLMINAAKYRSANKKILHAKSRAWFRAHPGYATAWHRAHREELNSKRRARWRANPEKERAAGAAWKRAHPEIRAAAESRRRARKLGAVGSFTNNEWLALGWSVSWHCLYCGVRLTPKMAVREHRIPLVRGGSNHIGNIAVACGSCNSSKSTLTDVEYLSDRGADRIEITA